MASLADAKADLARARLDLARARLRNVAQPSLRAADEVQRMMNRFAIAKARVARCQIGAVPEGFAQ